MRARRSSEFSRHHEVTPPGGAQGATPTPATNHSNSGSPGVLIAGKSLVRTVGLSGSDFKDSWLSTCVLNVFQGLSNRRGSAADGIGSTTQIQPRIL